MALVLAEGFRYSDRVLVLKYSAGSGTTTYSRVAGRAPGTYALQYSNSSGSGGSSYAASLTVYTPTGQFSIGFHMNNPNWPGAVHDASGFAMRGSDNININYACSLVAGSPVGNNTQVASGCSGFTSMDNSIVTPGWHWWNIVWNQHATAGFLRVYRDGTLAMQAQPDTIPTSSNDYYGGIFKIHLPNATGGINSAIADLIVRNDTNLIPPSRVDTLLPTVQVSADFVGSDGDSVDNNLLVDDPGPTTDLSDYAASTTVGATDVFQMSDLPVTPASIYGVQVTSFTQKQELGPRAMAVLANSSEIAATDKGSDAFVYGVYETDPSTSQPWTAAGVNAMTAGYRIKS